MDLHTGNKKLKNWSNTLNTHSFLHIHTSRESQVTGQHQINWRIKLMKSVALEFSTQQCKKFQRQVKLPFCSCMPDAFQILARGYLASTPVYPQTEFLLHLLNFYHLLWNLSNATTTSFAEVLHKWNNSLSSKNSIHNKTLLKLLNLHRSKTSWHNKHVLYLGQPFPVLTLPNHGKHTKSSFALMAIFSIDTLSGPPKTTCHSKCLSSKENPATGKTQDPIHYQCYHRTEKGCDNTGLMGAFEPGRAAVYQFKSSRGSSKNLIHIQISTFLSYSIHSRSSLNHRLNALHHCRTFHNMIGLEKLSNFIS
ncbi:hypothetical protein VP01_597g9 [Puccinia sorghi]|uniref:CxC1-like cysteine cluster associated with KDZ transposases domain-containing protein n=1 Tax=Puccinia sorghi TaxID=27349 RepID=A0A0L6UJN0_9BASI|nr:hypothetical protein VP01_597g9 [Puccinia sorghi]